MAGGNGKKRDPEITSTEAPEEAAPAPEEAEQTEEE